MGKIKDRKRLITRLENANLFGDKYRISENGVINGLYRDFCVLLKIRRRYSEIYDKLFSSSEYKDVVRYKYRRCRMRAKHEDERRLLTFEEHALMKERLESNIIEKNKYRPLGFRWCSNDLFTEWATDGSGSGAGGYVVFKPSERHIKMLKELDRVERISRQVKERVLSSARRLVSVIKSSGEYINLDEIGVAKWLHAD